MRVFIGVVLLATAACTAITKPPRDFYTDPDLEEARSHRYIFVSGPHHSGTTLLALLLSKNPAAAGLVNTSKPQDEGQHLQTHYKKAYEQGGMTAYAYAAHRTEDSDLCSKEGADHLYRSWSPYWNLEKNVLVEKTPNHMVMTRLLQCLFTPERTSHVILLRHPLGATYFKWKLPQQEEAMRLNCGENYIEHWLQQMDTVKEDLPHLRTARVVMFENFTVGNVQEHYDRLLGSIGLAPSMKVSTAARSPRKPYKDIKARYLRRLAEAEEAAGMGMARKSAKQKQRHGRRLLGYRGSRPGDGTGPSSATPTDIVVKTEKWMIWVDAFEERFGQGFMSSDLCQKVFNRFEARVNGYGYSLLHPERVTIPEPFRANLVIPRVDDNNIQYNGAA